jgi:hypothetical protein
MPGVFVLRHRLYRCSPEKFVNELPPFIPSLTKEGPEGRVRPIGSTLGSKTRGGNPQQLTQIKNYASFT